MTATTVAGARGEPNASRLLNSKVIKTGHAARN